VSIPHSLKLASSTNRLCSCPPICIDFSDAYTAEPFFYSSCAPIIARPGTQLSRGRPNPRHLLSNVLWSLPTSAPPATISTCPTVARQTTPECTTCPLGFAGAGERRSRRRVGRALPAAGMVPSGSLGTLCSSARSFRRSPINGVPSGFPVWPALCLSCSLLVSRST
jgi:hypothetical protein